MRAGFYLVSYTWHLPDFCKKLQENKGIISLFHAIIIAKNARKFSIYQYFELFSSHELGVAYSYLFNKYEKNGEEYIFPFALYPETKGNALSGTPMANIQTGEINDENDIRSFLECLSADKNLFIKS